MGGVGGGAAPGRHLRPHHSQRGRHQDRGCLQGEARAPQVDILLYLCVREISVCLICIISLSQSCGLPGWPLAFTCGPDPLWPWSIGGRAYEPNAVCWPISPRDCHFSYRLLIVVQGTVHVLGPWNFNTRETAYLAPMWPNFMVLGGPGPDLWPLKLLP